MKTDSTTIPTREENQKLERLFLAIYFNDLDKVVEFKNQYPEIYEKRTSFCIESDVYFDLTNLTFFNQKVWNDEYWIAEIMPSILIYRRKTAQMIDFWKTENKNPELKRNIEYNQYYEYFFCKDPNDPEAEREILIEPMSYYLEQGFREIDLRLYNRAECFDFPEVKKLLENGANSDVDLEHDNDSSTLSRIGGELSYLASCSILPKFERFYQKGYNQEFEITDLFRDLLGLAAHQEMYDLLSHFYINNKE